MVSLIKKVTRGRTYYYAADSRRVEGKPRIVWQKYLGTDEKIVIPSSSRFFRVLCR